MKLFLNYLVHSSVLLGIALICIRLPFLQRARARDILLKVAFIVSFLSPLLAGRAFLWPEPAHIYLPVIQTLTFPDTSAEPAKDVRVYSPVRQAPNRNLDMFWIPLGLLCSGLLLMLYQFMKAWRSVRYLLLHSSPLPLDFLEKLSVPLWVTVRISKYVQSPLAFGRKTVIVPELLFQRFSQQQLQAVLQHEVAHLERCDPLWTTVFSLVAWTCFFQPLNFLVLRAWRQASEELCDAKAVKVTRNPGALAQSILDITQQLSQQNLLTTGMAYKTHLRQRIEAVLTSREVNMKRSYLALIATFPLLMALLLPLFSMAQSTKVVVLDAGHGGPDLGAVEGTVNESAINLSVALKVKALLEQQGITVIMTREKDEFVELEQRLDFITPESDIFISLHTMAALTPQAHGIETWVAGNDKDEDIDNKAELIATEKDFAKTLHSNLITATGAKDRGVRENAFFVLRRSPIPSIILEMGFISNPEEAQKLIDNNYQQNLANVVAETLINFLKE